MEERGSSSPSRISYFNLEEGHNINLDDKQSSPTPQCNGILISNDFTETFSSTAHILPDNVQSLVSSFEDLRFNFQESIPTSSKNCSNLYEGDPTCLTRYISGLKPIIHPLISNELHLDTSSAESSGCFIQNEDVLEQQKQLTDSSFVYLKGQHNDNMKYLRDKNMKYANFLQFSSLQPLHSTLFNAAEYDIIVPSQRLANQSFSDSVNVNSDSPIRRSMINVPIDCGNYYPLIGQGRDNKFGTPSLNCVFSNNHPSLFPGESETHWLPKGVENKSFRHRISNEIHNQITLKKNLSMNFNTFVSNAHVRSSSINSFQNSGDLYPNNSDLRPTLDFIQENYASLHKFMGRNFTTLYPANYNIRPALSQMQYINLMARDLDGCKLLVKQLAEGDPAQVHKIFAGIIYSISDLMVHQFGNNLVQKLIEVCSESQRMCIICAITKQNIDLVRISCNQYGNLVVQKVIEVCKPAGQSLIALSLGMNTVMLITDVYGFQVAQKCLLVFCHVHKQFILNAVIDNCISIATSHHGCHVIQQCLEYSQGEMRNRLVSAITVNIQALSDHPFGNYVAQSILDLKFPLETSLICNKLEGRFGELSMQKFGSNVVEKCLVCARTMQCIKIIQELVDHPRLVEIMLDCYGNYVIQTALKESKKRGHLHGALMKAIRFHRLTLSNSQYGRKVLGAFSRLRC